MEKEIVVFDLDGTLANIDHRLHFIQGENKDWEGFFGACPGDKPIQDTIDICNNLFGAGLVILIVSGRSETVREQTEIWLEENGIDHMGLYMRSQGDFRPDYEIKKELLTNGVIPADNILCVFEDRASVVEMWRNMGLTCYQVDKGEF